MTYYKVTYYKAGKLNIPKTLVSYTKYYIGKAVDNYRAKRSYSY